MANEKQRRRRAKEKRHEYELVYTDEEGNEVPVVTESSARKPPARVGGGKGSPKKQQRSSSSGRKPPQQPSWPRVLKRGAIFAPVFLITVYLLGGDSMTVTSAVVQALLLIGVFIPFSYFMDKVVWRQYQKRLGKTG